MAFGGVTEAESTTYYPIDYLTDTIKCSLHTSALAPNQDTHDFWDDCAASEIAASGTYAAKGLTLASKTLTYTANTNVVMFDAADAVWTGVTAADVQYAVIYKYTDATTSHCPLMGYINNGAVLVPSNATMTVAFAAAGIFTITPA